MLKCLAAQIENKMINYLEQNPIDTDKLNKIITNPIKTTN